MSKIGFEDLERVFWLSAEVIPQFSCYRGSFYASSSVYSEVLVRFSLNEHKIDGQHYLGLCKCFEEFSRRVEEAEIKWRD